MLRRQSSLINFHYGKISPDSYDVDQLGTDNLQSIKTKDLSIIDLRHFGWNIWNFFKPRNQMDIAHFLKIVFPDILKEAEAESIKRHLKDDELKGIIKIQERLSALQKLE